MSQEINIITKHIQKHDYEVNWLKSSLIPAKGQVIIYDREDLEDNETHELPNLPTGRTSRYTYARFKIGDGKTTVSDLPFSAPQADWNQSDENAADYVKNRTHYETINYKNERVFCEELYCFYDGPPCGYAQTQFSITDSVDGMGYTYWDHRLKNNSTKVRLTFDTGKTVEEALIFDQVNNCWKTPSWNEFDLENSSASKASWAVFIQESTYEDETSYTENYEPATVSDYEITLAFDANRLGEAYHCTLTVFDSTTSTTKLPKKYLPTDVAYKTDIPKYNFATEVPKNQKQANWQQNNSVAPDYINNRTHYEIKTGDIETILAIDGDYVLASLGGLPNYKTDLENVILPTESFVLQEGDIVEANIEGQSISGVAVYNEVAGIIYVPSDDYGDNFFWAPAGEDVIFTWLDADIGYGDPTGESDWYWPETIYVKITIQRPAATNKIITLDEKYIPESIARKADVETAVNSLVDTAPEALNTLNELSKALGDDPNFATTVLTEIGKKVDKVDGKGLSTNDYTDTEKNKLAGIEIGAQKNVQGNWNQNDETAPDYIKNRTHYEMDVETHIELGEVIVNVPEYYGTTAGNFANTLDIDIDSLVGKVFIVTIDDSTTYQDTLKYGLYMDEHPIYYLGDYMGYLDGGSADFGLSLDTTSISICADFESLNVSPNTQIKVNISYIGFQPGVKQLDEKYIPDTIARSNSVEEINNSIISLQEQVNDLNTDVVKSVNDKTPDSNGAVNITYAYGDLTDKPFGIVQEEGYVNVGIFDGRTFNFTEDMNTGWHTKKGLLYRMSIDDPIFVLSDKYLVTYDGVEYYFVLVEQENQTYSLELEGVPIEFKFNFEDGSKTKCSSLSLHHYGAGEHTIKVTVPGTVDVVKPIDDKYIPDTIARTQTVDEKISQSFTSHEPTELIRTSNNSDHSNYVVGSKRQSSDKILYGLHSSNYPEYFPFWDNHNVGSTFLLEIIKDSNIIFSEKLIWHKELSYEHTDESVLGNFALLTDYSDLGDTGELAAIYINDAESYIDLYLDEGLLEIDDVVTAKLYYCEEKINTIDDITVNTTQLNNILSNIDNHEYGDYIIAFEPSCTSKGKRYQVCSCCGNKRIEYIPSQGHREAQANEIPVSQLDYGYTSGVYCDRCGITLSGREPIENAGLYESETNNRILTLDELVSTNPEDEGTELLTYIDGYFGSGALSYGNPDGITGDVVIPEGCIYLYKKDYESGGLGFYPNITGVVIPSTCIDLGGGPFYGDRNLSRITYKGTIAQWNNLSKGEDWYPTDEEYKPVKCTVSCSDGNLPVDVLFNREPGLYQTGTTTRLKTIDEMLSEDNDLTYSNGYFGSWRLSEDNATQTAFVGDLVLPKDVTHLYNADFGTGGLATYGYITSIVIPITCIDIGSSTFYGCSRLSKIIYEGTMEQWNSVNKGKGCYSRITEEIKVYCTDGIITIIPSEEV